MEIAWTIHVERESGNNEWTTVTKFHLVDETFPGQEDYWYQSSDEHRLIGPNEVAGRWCRVSSFRRISLFDSTGNVSVATMTYSHWPLQVGSTGRIHFSRPLSRAGSQLEYTYCVWAMDHCLEAVVDSGIAAGMAAR